MLRHSDGSGAFEHVSTMSAHCANLSDLENAQRPLSGLEVAGLCRLLLVRSPHGAEGEGPSPEQLGVYSGASAPLQMFNKCRATALLTHTSRLEASFLFPPQLELLGSRQEQILFIVVVVAVVLLLVSLLLIAVSCALTQFVIFQDYSKSS